MEKQRIYKRPKTRDDMLKLFEQVFYEVRHWYANEKGEKGLAKHIRDTFKKRPSDLTVEDLAKANTMTLDEWMEFSKAKYIQHLERATEQMRERRQTLPTIHEVKPLPIDHTPMEELLPGFEARQTAIDFETVAVSDNLGQLIIETRRIATALERLARGMDSSDLFHVETH